jgi:hypothetical protein
LRSGAAIAAKRYRIGVLFSNSSPYGVVSGSMRNGALLAFDEISRNGAYRFELEPVAADPAGDPARYSQFSAALLGEGIRHVVGCYTSSSRKDVIPLFEKYDTLLWYPSHYEGFESSTNVVYTGAAPNQHIIPLIEYLAGPSAYEQVYGLFPILKERAGQRAGTLSGGQQQQLAIGRIIVDFNRRTGITIVFVEQNLDMIRAIAQRCYVMDKGRIVAELKPHDLDDRDTIRKHLAV